MKIAFVYYNDFSESIEPDAFLSRRFTIADWAEALTKARQEVSVFLRYSRDLAFIREGVRYFFYQDSLPPRLKARSLPWRYTKKVQKQLLQNPPDLIHAHNLNSILPNLMLRFLIPRAVPMLLQDHGSVLPAKRYRPLQKLLFQKTDGLIFAALGQEEIWLQKNMIKQPEKCFFVMENSSPFSHKPRLGARKRTGMAGNPIFLWVGNLDRNKDPFSILSAFKKTATFLPAPRLYMIYRQEPEGKKVRRLINDSDFLKKTVLLLGSIERKDLEDYYNSADYFLLGSRKEGSGYALIEALSCGLVPIVSDIPSFRRLTNQGEIGGLWEAGNERQLLNQIQTVSARPLARESSKALRFFEENFRFPVLVKTMLEAYSKAISFNKKW